METDVLRILSVLGTPLADQADFCRRLIKSGDEYLRVAGIAALLEFSALPRDDWEEAITLSRHGAVATRACRFFTAHLEHELAERALAAFDPSGEFGALEEMRAILRQDSRALVEIYARRFLNDARVEHLVAAAQHSEAASGWRDALLWVARATVMQPAAPGGWGLLRLLEIANQHALMKKAIGILEKGGFFPEVRAVFKAALLLQGKDPEGALKAVSKLRLSEIRSGDTVRTKLCLVRAQAYEALRQYPEALKWYAEFNRQGVPRGLDKHAYLASIERFARADYPELSEDRHRDHFMMLGFPRSGTTLLENALAAHPEIETFEEIPSLPAMTMQVERILAQDIADKDERRAAFENARERYYDEIDRRKLKAGARVFIDKLPVRSAWIEVMEKFFPEKRYIFSIRHPYDVVLSCYRQSFTPNSAMENFRTIEDACEFYDRVMSIWFGVFPAESERVLYVRYEELVQDFQKQVTRALDFVGVGWDDSVLRFSELSEERKATTPSYSKVRSGLALGVQSSWRNYRSVFDTPHGAKLHKWVDRFGYER